MPEGKQFYVIKEDPYLIQKKVKAHSRELLIDFLKGFVVLYIFMNWVPEILGMIVPVSYIDVLSNVVSVNKEIAAQLPSIPFILYVFAALFNGVVKLGEALYVLTFVRNRRVEYESLMEGFSYYFKAFGLFLAEVFIIAIWSMLFIIPGLIAAINFSQAFYIFADDPDKKIFEILAESKMRMLGNRMTYVKFIISFLPYLLLAYLPAAVLALIPSIDFSSWAGMAILMIAEIPLYCAYGYLAIGRGVFYELLISEGFENFRYSGETVFRNDFTE